jgi:hypothetical protein
MKEERNGILILEDVAKQVVSSRRKELAMFGRRDFVTIGNVPYDLIFHYASRVPIDKINLEPYLIVPVLSLQSPREDDKLKVIMHELCQRNEDIDTFAARHHYNGRISLKFFNTCRLGIGTEIRNVKEYRIAGEDDFRAIYGDKWDEVARNLSEIKKRINIRYCA